MIDKKTSLLLLLRADDEKPIFGKTRFMKLMYIADKELAKKGISVNLYNFCKHYYGPYSDELTTDLESLVREKLVSCDIRISGVFKENIYTLTKTGEQLLPKDLDSNVVKIFETVKRRYGDMSLSSLIREVYTNYPISQL